MAINIAKEIEESYKRIVEKAEDADRNIAQRTRNLLKTLLREKAPKPETQTPVYGPNPWITLGQAVFPEVWDAVVGDEIGTSRRRAQRAEIEKIDRREDLILRAWNLVEDLEFEETFLFYEDCCCRGFETSVMAWEDKLFDYLDSLPTVRVNEVLPREDADSKPVATATIVKIIRSKRRGRKKGDSR